MRQFALSLDRVLHGTVAVVGALLLSACGTSPSPSVEEPLVHAQSSDTPSPCAPVLADGAVTGMSCTYSTMNFTESLTDQVVELNTTRTVFYQTPIVGSPPPNGWPVVLFFAGTLAHGNVFFTGTVDSFEDYTASVAVKTLLDSGYAVLAPDAGTAIVAWNTNVPPYSLDWTSAPDNHFMQQILAAIKAGSFGPIDTTRMFATGASSGGYMTSRMAIAYPGTFKALVIESGSYADCLGPVCVIPALPANHPPTLFLHGSADPIVPVATMQEYYMALQTNGTETQAIIQQGAGHQWIDAAATALPNWIITHD